MVIDPGVGELGSREGDPHPGSSGSHRIKSCGKVTKILPLVGLVEDVPKSKEACWPPGLAVSALVASFTLKSEVLPWQLNGMSLEHAELDIIELFL